MSKPDLNCSFCGRAKPETQFLIAGLDAHICDRCILQAHGIVMKKHAEERKTNSLNSNLPREIKSFFRRICDWPRSSKRVLSVAVYNHYKRLHSKIKNE